MPRRTTHEREDALLARAAAVQLRRLQRFECIENSRQAEAYFRARMAHLPHEELHALTLDALFRVIACDLVALGSIDGASVDSRVLLHTVLKRNACYLMLAHNHPSGDCTPSNADIAMTNKLVVLLREVGVTLLDHVIIGAERSHSFNDTGLLSRH